MKNLYYIASDRVMGRGIYANTDLSAGTVIMSCELLVLSETDTPKVNETDLQYYTFVYNEKQDCLVLGDGEIFNHDDNPSVDYKLITVYSPETKETRKKMQFTLLRDVKKDEQLFIDYNADTKVNTQDYVSQKSLTGE